ncbi:hypothetical protein DOTSEDRAFT_68393 [Dothistroma septosporum NZE10]|uniref:Selenoprotein W-like protein n=1 Tax=Dothistroma septosporum (strain NZE10 / CBS 128990) TaxID=675120 RepID=N1Q1J3_DOTSN|nr:hypothetical protein DOTSEDRAFT_68393 [Dothistroma septosporum NZE10]
MAELSTSIASSVKLPRVTITYCTQCKWLLRAAYFGQELLSTFGTSIGEVALIPAVGGIFEVHVTHVTSGSATKKVMLWDRKAEGGFPETKILKQRLRNLIEPEKSLGHSDTPSFKAKPASGAEDSRDMNTLPQATASSAAEAREDCKDCA